MEREDEERHKQKIFLRDITTVHRKRHSPWFNGIQSSYPIVEYCVLGHAVGSTELLHPASVVAVQHFLADAGAVGAGTPGVILVTRRQVMFEEQLTA